MWQIAHRGYSSKYGDNNELSISKSIEFEFDMVEVDIQFSKDREIVVYHDIDISENYVSSFTRKELKKRGLCI